MSRKLLYCGHGDEAMGALDHRADCKSITYNIESFLLKSNDIMKSTISNFNRNHQINIVFNRVQQKCQFED